MKPGIWFSVWHFFWMLSLRIGPYRATRMCMICKGSYGKSPTTKAMHGSLTHGICNACLPGELRKIRAFKESLKAGGGKL